MPPYCIVMISVVAAETAVLMDIAFINCAVPAMLMFKALPVEPTALAPEALMLAKLPVKAVMAPDSVTSSKDPVLEPAVVMVVDVEERTWFWPVERLLVREAKAMPALL